MSLLVLLTFIAAGLIVVAVAVSLVAIAVRLRQILFTLGTVNVGVRAIARRVEPLEPVLTEVNTDLGDARDGLAGVLRRRQERLAAQGEEERV